MNDFYSTTLGEEDWSIKKGSIVLLLKKEDWSKWMNSTPPLDDSTEGHWYEKVSTRSRIL